VIEGHETHLHVARIVPPRLARKVDVQSLGEWRQSANTVRTIEERGRPSDEDVETGESAAVEIVD
jgi:hypothetical protein